MRMRSNGRLVCALLAALSVLFLCHVYRENLIPWGATDDRAQWLLTGDEPTYLLMAMSIARGDGLNVGPAHEAGDYKAFQSLPVIKAEDYTWDHYFGTGWLEPTWGTAEEWGGARKPPFSPLLPSVVSLFVNHTPHVRWWTAFMQAGLLAVCAFCLVLSIPSDAGMSNLVHSMLAVVFVSGSLPVVYYTAAVFPETIAGVMLVAYLCLCERRSLALRLIGAALLSLSLFATPRVAGGIAMLMPFLIWQAWFEERWQEPLIVALVGVLFVAFNLLTWGTCLPPASGSFIKGFLVPSLRAMVDPSEPGKLLYPEGLARFFYSRDHGVFFLGPVFLAGVVAGVLVVRAEGFRRNAAWLLLVLGLTVTISLYTDYRAGICPMGRYQVIPAYLLVYPMLKAIRTIDATWRRRLISSIYTLGAIGLILGLSVAQHPNWWFRRYLPVFGHKWLQPYYEWLPDCAGWSTAWKIAAWTLVFAVPLFFPDLAKRIRRRITARSCCPCCCSGSGDSRS